MSAKPIDRLMFAQGGLCFFCRQPLPRGEASVEHLVASANGGSNADDNCVACCKAINALLGSMSLKEKLQVVLNQKGQFKRPDGTGAAKADPQPKAKPKTRAAAQSGEDKINLVIANLKQRGNAKPRTLKTLKGTVASLFPKGISEPELEALPQRLQSLGKVAVSENKATYAIQVSGFMPGAQPRALRSQDAARRIDRSGSRRNASPAFRPPVACPRGVGTPATGSAMPVARVRERHPLREAVGVGPHFPGPPAAGRARRPQASSASLR